MFEISQINPNEITLEVWELVIAQIKKDFNENNLSIELTKKEQVFEDVFNALKEFLCDSNRLEQDYYQLLYRIDVPEKYVHRLRKINNLESFNHQLTQIILKREIQKVLIRRHFSQ